MAPRIRYTRDEYTVAWICAKPVEMAAAQCMLDQIHENLPVQPNDSNSYILGRIREHNVVIACSPRGKDTAIEASSVVVRLLSSFRSVRFGLIVGTGGGIPSGGADVRLGDIVVSRPTGMYGGVVQCDYGAVLNDGHFGRKGVIASPPQILLTALSKLQAHQIIHTGEFLNFYSELEWTVDEGSSVFARPSGDDRLYHSDYRHLDTRSQNCAKCDKSKAVFQESRDQDTPVVHYGIVASSDHAVESSEIRDKLGRELGAYCVETKAAGVMDNLPCIVICGICDYADSHKDDKWQGYASGVAAAYAKELLLNTSVVQADQRASIFRT